MKAEPKNPKESADSQPLGLLPLRSGMAGTGQLDPKASAALAQAVLSAKKAEKNSTSARTGDERRLQLPKQGGGLTRQLVVHSALLLILASSCWFAGYAGTYASRSTLEQIALDTAQHRQALAHLDHNLEALQSIVGTLKSESDKVSASDLSYRSKLAKDVESVAFSLKEPGMRMSGIEARIDRMEQQITAAIANLASKASAPSPASPLIEASAQTGSVEPKPDAGTDAKPDVRSDIKPEAKVDAKLEAKPEAKPDNRVA